MIDAYGLPNRLAALEELLSQPLETIDRAHCLAELSWYMRERDTRRALDLVAEAERILPSATSPRLASLAARLSLVRGEAQRLYADLDSAERLCREAMEGFQRSNDLIGLGDARFCEAERLFFMGSSDAALDQLVAARVLFLQAEDMVRARVAEVWSVWLQISTNIPSARQRWAKIADLEAPEHPAALAMTAFVDASLMRDQSEFQAVIVRAKAGLPAAEESGMVWLSIAIMNLIGGAYANLSEYASAMEWKEKAYTLAQPTGWPESRGSTLASLAHTQGRIGQKTEARSLYIKALAELEKLSGTRRFGLTCVTYGNTCLELGAHEEALHWFQRAKDAARQRGFQDVELSAQIGVARTKIALSRPAEAVAHLTGALQIARLRNNRLEAVVILHSLARAKRSLAGGAPDVRRETSALLEEAIAVSNTIPGYVLRSDLLSELAGDYEALGDYPRALKFERMSRASWEQAFNKESSERLLAMQVRFQNQRAREEAEHMKALAAAEADRARALDRTNRTLELLGRVGQEITASLDTEAVCQTLYRHLNDLMDTPCMSIGLLDAEAGRIEIRFRMEDGRRLPARSMDLSSRSSFAAQAVRENREILVGRTQGEQDPSFIAGTRAMQTLFFRPLAIGDRVIGVLSLQHDQEDAYGPHELQVARSVCAYAAIALSNAEAYRSLDATLATLREAQGRLVNQEKLASLGQLVAGVAHEVNTPVGILLSLSSHLAEEVPRVRARLEAGSLRKSELMDHFTEAEETGRLMLANARRAANLVSAFKQVAADRTHDDVREFRLADYAAEIAATVEPLLRPRGVRLEIVGDNPLLSTYPGLLAQVVTNLMQNAITHAFEGVDSPKITLGIAAVADADDEERVELRIADNGVGMTRDVAAKAFEPFFTTRRNSGGTGLGLHVTYNVVTGPLQGEVRLETAPGQGAAFILRLPRRLEPAPVSEDHAMTMALVPSHS